MYNLQCISVLYFSSNKIRPLTNGSEHKIAVFWYNEVTRIPPFRNLENHSKLDTEVVMYNSAIL